MNGKLKTLCIWLALGLVFVGLYALMSDKPSHPRRDYAEFVEDVKQGRVDTIRYDGQQFHVKLFEGGSYSSPGVLDNALSDTLSQHGVGIEWGKKKNPWIDMFLSVFPIVLLVALFIYFLKKSGGGVTGRPREAGG